MYSLAIRLHEFFLEQQTSLPIQMFGTDISDPALDRARQGIYSGIITETVSEQRLRRFFTKIDGGYQINKMIRECCVFARHDVTRDPPFSRLDVVSCRNVLIYLDGKAQRKVLPTFHYALNPTGLLMLGSAETAGAAADLFSVLDKTHHIYTRKAVPTRLMLDFTSRPLAPDAPGGTARAEAAGSADFQKKLERVIQARYSPDGVVVTGDLQIIEFRGHTAPYLDPSPGEASFNLLRMVKESLVVPCVAPFKRQPETDMLVQDEGATIELNGQQEQIVLEVTPIVVGEGPERYFLIVFDRPAARRQQDAAAQYPATTEHEAHILERELSDTREYLRNIREEYEAHAEELRAANEEAHSANEELQSTNEELGARRRNSSPQMKSSPPLTKNCRTATGN